MWVMSQRCDKYVTFLVAFFKENVYTNSKLHVFCLEDREIFWQYLASTRTSIGFLTHFGDSDVHNSREIRFRVSPRSVQHP